MPAELCVCTDFMTIQETEGSAFAGIDRISRDMRETSLSHISYNESLKSIYFPSPRDMSGSYYGIDMVSTWQSWIIYYLFADPGNNSSYYLARKQKSGSLDNPPDIAAETSNLDSATIAARNVYAIEVTLPPADRKTVEIKLHTRADYRGRACSFSVGKRISVNQNALW